MDSSTSWFQPTPRYEGPCELTFIDAGRINGAGVLEIDIDLKSRAALVVSAVECVRPLPFPLSIAQRPSGKVARAIPDADEVRYADSFSLDAGSGVVRSLEGKIYFSSSAHLGERSALTVDAYPGFIDYVADSGAQAEYVVAPLVNFLQPWQTSDPALDSHPLRLLRVIKAPQDFVEKYPEVIRLEQRRLNGVVEFHLLGSPAYIQPVPAYTTIESGLVSGSCRARITSMIVCSAAGLDPTGADLLRRFPFDLARVLSLAVGVDVSIPWLEVRAPDRSLVRRVHLPSRPADFRQGTRYLDEQSCGGLSRLLSVAPRSPHFGSPHIRVALGALAALRGHHLNLDRGLRDLLVALEALALGYTTKHQARKARVAEKWATRAREILEGASRELDALADEAAAQGAEGDSRRLKKVAKTVHEEPLDDVGFS